MNRTRALAAVVLAGGVVFGAMGGEYSTLDWWTLRRSLAEEESAIRRLAVENDSLAGVATALESDPVAQERAAREAFGMLRPGEILYRIERRGRGRDSVR